MKKEYIELLDDERWNTKRLSILKRDKFTCRICGATHETLCVHHKYYIFDAYPWEYNDDALVTLCYNCHYLIHKTINPLVYVKSSSYLKLMNFTPCARCGGRGVMPEYNHIEGGICFRCNGLRFEELIGRQTDIIDFKNYMSTSEDSFDLLNQNIENVDCMKIFADAKNYHFGMNGFPYNLDIAERKYRIAALNGYFMAQNNLGLILCHKKQYSSALRWFVYAAMQGCVQAQINILRLISKKEHINITENEKIVVSWKKIKELNNSEDFKIEQLAEFIHILNHADRQAIVDLIEDI